MDETSVRDKIGALPAVRGTTNRAALGRRDLRVRMMPSLAVDDASMAGRPEHELRVLATRYRGRCDLIISRLRRGAQLAKMASLTSVLPTADFDRSGGWPR